LDETVTKLCTSSAAKLKRHLIFDQARSYLTCHTNCKIGIVIDDQERLLVFRQVDYIPLSQANEARFINNVGSACEPSKLLGYSSWQHILDNTDASYDVLFQPSFPEIQSNNMEINSTSQPYEVMGQPFSSSIVKQHQNGSLIQNEGNWQVLD